MEEVAGAACSLSWVGFGRTWQRGETGQFSCNPVTRETIIVPSGILDRVCTVSTSYCRAMLGFGLGHQCTLCLPPSQEEQQTQFCLLAFLRGKLRTLKNPLQIENTQLLLSWSSTLNLMPSVTEHWSRRCAEASTVTHWP